LIPIVLDVPIQDKDAVLHDFGLGVVEIGTGQDFFHCGIDHLMDRGAVLVDVCAALLIIRVAGAEHFANVRGIRLSLCEIRRPGV
jgi:hypothetical protein